MTAKEKNQDITTPKPPGVSNPLECLLGYQLRRASQTMLADLGVELAKLDVKVTEMSALMIIGANPGITQSEVSRILAIQRANMVPLVTQLEKRGAICKAVATGRAQALRLTPAGRRLMRQCQKLITAHENRFLNDISKAERETLIETVRLVWATQS